MKFIKENTQLSSKGYIRTGIYKTNINNYNIMVIRNKYNKDYKPLGINDPKLFGTYYNISLSKDNNFDWLYNTNLKNCKTIINNIKNSNQYGLKNSY